MISMLLSMTKSKKSLMQLDWIISFFLFIVFVIVIISIVLSYQTTKIQNQGSFGTLSSKSSTLFDSIKQAFYTTYSVTSHHFRALTSFPISSRQVSYTILYDINQIEHITNYPINTNNTIIYSPNCINLSNKNCNSLWYRSQHPNNMFASFNFNSHKNIIILNHLTNNKQEEIGPINDLILTELFTFNSSIITYYTNNSYFSQLNDSFVNTTYNSSSLVLYFLSNILDRAYYNSKLKIKSSRILIDNLELNASNYNINFSNQQSSVLASYDITSNKINISTYVIAHNNIINYIFSTSGHNITFNFELDNYHYFMLGDSSIIMINYSQNHCYTYNNTYYVQFFDTTSNIGSLNIKLLSPQECSMISKYFSHTCDLSHINLKICHTNTSQLNISLTLSNFSGVSHLFLFFDDLYASDSKAIYDFNYSSYYTASEVLNLISLNKLKDKVLESSLENYLNFNKYNIIVYYNASTLDTLSNTKFYFNLSSPPQFANIIPKYYPIFILNQSSLSIIPGILMITLWG